MLDDVGALPNGNVNCKYDFQVVSMGMVRARSLALNFSILAHPIPEDNEPCKFLRAGRKLQVPPKSQEHVCRPDQYSCNC